MRPDRRHRPTCLHWALASTFSDVGWRPAADLYRTNDGWLVKFDLAGVDPHEVTVRTEGRRLTVTGERHDCCLGEGCHYQSLEIAYSRFERHVDIPVDLEAAHLTTVYEAGMLLVRIQTEEVRP